MTPVSVVNSTESCEIYRLGHYLGSIPKRVGLITASDQTVQVVHSCNSWFCLVPLSKTQYVSYYGFIPFSIITSIMSLMS